MLEASATLRSEVARQRRRGSLTFVSREAFSGGSLLPRGRFLTRSTGPDSHVQQTRGALVAKEHATVHQSHATSCKIFIINVRRHRPPFVDDIQGPRHSRALLIERWERCPGLVSCRFCQRACLLGAMARTATSQCVSSSDAGPWPAAECPTEVDPKPMAIVEFAALTSPVSDE